MQNRDIFPRARVWANQQAKDGNVEVTAYCKAQSDRIMKNPDGPHQWDVPYNFARTAACVMRLGMLMATDLEPRFYNSVITSVRENTRAFRIMGEQERINEGDLLAASRVETLLFFSFFDSMYAYDCIMPLLHDQPQIERRQSMRRRMIVFNPGHNVIWKITATLYIVSNGRRVLEARPFVTVWRYDRVEGREIVPLPDDDIQNNVAFEEVVEDIRNMGLEDFLR